MCVSRVCLLNCSASTETTTGQEFLEFASELTGHPKTAEKRLIWPLRGRCGETKKAPTRCRTGALRTIPSTGSLLMLVPVVVMMLDLSRELLSRDRQHQLRRRMFIIEVLRQFRVREAELRRLPLRV